MNTEEKVSPDNLTGKGFEDSFDIFCPCCGSENIGEDGCIINTEDGEAYLEYECSDCDSNWWANFKINFCSTYIDKDSYNTYNRWLAENRDKKIGEILKD